MVSAWTKIKVCVIFIGVGLYVWDQNRSNQKGLVGFDAPIERIMIFGDGLTTEVEAGEETLVDHLSAAANWKVGSLGAGFKTTAEAIENIDKVPQVSTASVVVVALGVFDILEKVPLKETLENLERVFEGFSKKGFSVAYLGFAAPPAGDNWLLAVSHLCKTKGVLYLGDLTPKHWSYKAALGSKVQPLQPSDIKRVAGTMIAELKPYI